MIRWLLPAALMLALHAPAAALPEPHTAVYAVHANGAHVGRMERRLEIDPEGSYVFESVTTPVGIVALVRRDRIVESSQGTVENGRLKPSEYHYEHSGTRKPKSVSVSFDWPAGRITNVAKGRSWQLEAAPNTLDKLLYQVVLMHDLARGLRDVSYEVADGGQIKTYHFVVLGEERVETPAGTFDTLKIERSKPGSDRRTTIWCAPELGYLPVKVDYADSDGDDTSVVLESSAGLGPPPS